MKIDNFFVACDLEIWQMTLKNNSAPLLCYFRLCASFHSHQRIHTGVTDQKCPIWVKICDFFCTVWPWNLMDDLEKKGHLFYATSSFVHHCVSISELKMELQSGKSQFGSKSAIFRPVDLEIWWMTLNKANLRDSGLTGHIVPLRVEQSKKSLKPGHHKVCLHCHDNQDLNFNSVSVTFAESSKLQQMAHLKETPKIYFLVYRAKSSPRNQNRYAHRSIVSHAKCSFLKVFFILWKIEVESPIFMINIWARSRRWGCLVTWICYHLIAKPGNKTGIPSGPDPYRE